MIGKVQSPQQIIAMENGEKFEKDQVEIPGVEIKKRYNRGRDLWTTLVKNRDRAGGKADGKACGNLCDDGSSQSGGA